MYLLEGEAGVFLVAFGREADIIELDLIRSACDGCFGQSNVVFLYFDPRGVGPDQLAVLAPGLAVFLRLHRQFRMRDYEPLVPENGDARDRIHSLGMQEMCVLWQIANVGLV